MNASTRPKRTLVVVSHTHWDREWYLPFEAFRARLVGMMDSLLDLLDRDPEYKHFVLDGQTVPLDDYLEIRPDRRADIERLVRGGRLLIGPNYMLPDEFLIGGEAWVRNLMFGIRSARRFGEPMMLGYSPDAFGHIAHLPAILRGFGIDSVLIWRGVGPEATTSEFRWAAPDGSEVLAIHFPFGYGMFPVLPDNRDALATSLASIRKILEPLATTKYVLVPNGTDHLPAHTGLSSVIRQANEIMDDAEMVHGTYPMFVEAVRNELSDRVNDLPTLEGEFRSSARSNVLAGVLSARIWLKQRYQHCEDLLARYAEPLSTSTHLFRSDNGAANDTASTHGLLRQAWKHLLQNGPHDSVTGCSVDAVYTDVGARFDRCQQIADAVIHESLRYIADRAAPQGEQSVVVYNPEHGPRTDFCTVRLPAKGDKLPLRLTAPDGTEVDAQIIERGGHSPLDTRERVTIGFVPPAVHGHGYAAYGVADIEPPAAPELSSDTIENDFFRVTADRRNGTLTIEDKRSGVTHTGLNRFVDGGDVGDEYTYCPPKVDSIVSAPARRAEIRVTEAGPARRTLELRTTYSLPANADDESRSTECVYSEIVSRVSLYPGIARVDIETDIENNATDHRLRVHFPTGIRTDVSHAEQHFGVIERPVEVPVDDGTWFETPVGTYPQKTFVDISDGDRGLMLANRGLPEYEALREADGTITIALTLLRCVGWLSKGSMRTRKVLAGPTMEAPGAQMPGRWTFAYSIIPHEGGWHEAYSEAHRFVRPLRAVRTSRGNGSLPTSGSLVDIRPADAVLSTFKLAEDGDGVVARLYNIADEPITGRIRLPNRDRIGTVQRTNLNEEDPTPVDLGDLAVPLSLNRNEIATLKYTTNPPENGG
jgi:mannosylglycerate hydrolase